MFKDREDMEWLSKWMGEGMDKEDKMNTEQLFFKVKDYEMK